MNSFFSGQIKQNKTEEKEFDEQNDQKVDRGKTSEEKRRKEEESSRPDQTKELLVRSSSSPIDVTKPRKEETIELKSSIQMETIAEEFDIAFDNKVYNDLPFPAEKNADCNYENVQRVSRINSDSFYENVPDLSTYENVSEPYQNVTSAGKLSSVETSSYQNVIYGQSKTPNISDELFYQNVSFANPIKAQSVSKLPETNNNCVTPKSKTVSSEAIPEYENVDFEEEAVYQNMIVTDQRKLVPAPPSVLEPLSKNRRQTKFRHSRTKSSPSKLVADKTAVPDVFGVPAASRTTTTTSLTTAITKAPTTTSTSNDDDIYMKVRALRRSVQEVNAIIETEKLDCSQQKFETANSQKQSKNDGKQSSSVKSKKVSTGSYQEESKVNSDRKQSSCDQSVDQSVDRSSNFRAILTRFNNIGQTAGSSNSGSATTKDVHNFPRQRSTFYLQKDDSGGSDTRM